MKVQCQQNTLGDKKYRFCFDGFDITMKEDPKERYQNTLRKKVIPYNFMSLQYSLTLAMCQIHYSAELALQP